MGRPPSGRYRPGGGLADGDRVREAYPGAVWDRLAVKSRYDPDNLFRLNHNIPPYS